MAGIARSGQLLRGQYKGWIEGPVMCRRTLPQEAPMSICGLDFGTSNTTLGTIEGDAPVLAALEDGHATIPSAIFLPADGAVLTGRKAIEAYVDGVPGR